MASLEAKLDALLKEVTLLKREDQHIAEIIGMMRQMRAFAQVKTRRSTVHHTHRRSLYHKP
jgi:hypothetical protein